MDVGMIVSIAGVLVAGLAGVLGVWMERDSDGRMLWPLFFSSLILAATTVELVHTAYTEVVDSQIDNQLADVLDKLTELSTHNPELAQFVSTELAVQERANPNLVKKVEKNVQKRGGDPSEVRTRAAAARGPAASRNTPGAGGGGAPAARRNPGGSPPPGRDGGGTREEDTRTPKGRSGGPAGTLVDAASAGDATGTVEAADAAVKDAKSKVDDAKKQVDATKKAADDAAKDVGGAVDALKGTGGGGGSKGSKSGGGKGTDGVKIPGL